MSSPEPTSRLNAALEGRYRIERELGAGGMATVYLADDLRHERRVALKVLKPELAAVVGGERFLAEIKTTANLQHPHILPLFDSGQTDGFLFYVMPFIEGETLRERLDRERQLPLDEALEIATAVAGALQAAHEQGVVHRDVKPGNILLSRGQPLVADFGIALAVSASGGGRLTETGLSLGTPYYMSPEQATGDQHVGPASDTYALACVLFEMLAGEPPYTGSTAQAVLGKILQGAPVSATAVRRSVPAHVDAAIRKALEKLPADRFTATRDFATALSDPGFRHDETEPLGSPGGSGGWKRFALAMAGLATAASVAAVAGWVRTKPPPEPAARFESPFRGNQGPIGPFELVPDGSAVVYVGPGEAGGGQLWIRRWDDLEARPIPGTDGARVSLEGARLAVSPDGAEAAFVVGSPGPVRVVPLGGGPPRTLLESAWSVAWSDDGWVYFMHGESRELGRIRANGGGTEALTELSDDESFHAFPHPVPGGAKLLYQVAYAADGSDAEIWSLDLDTRERKALVSGNRPSYAASGHLLYGTTDNRIMAAPFDVRRSEITGAPVPVVEGAFTTSARRHVVYSIAADGTFAYSASTAAFGLHELVWVTRLGNASPVDDGEVFSLSPDGNDGWRISPDGRHIAFTRNVDGNDDIWVKALPAGPVSRVTFSPGMDLLPQWKPDGQSITYRNGPLGAGSLWSVRADGTGEPELAYGELNATKGVWSPNGEWLVIRTAGVTGDETARDIFMVRPGVDTVAVPLVATPGFWEQGPTISRNGRWLAYSSNESGRHEVFVRPFPDVGVGKWQISTDGGVNPVWAHNGRELFFFNPSSRQLRSAEFTATSTSFQLSRVTDLFEVPRSFFWNTNGNNDPYDVDLDDQRFLMARVYGSDDAPTPFVLVQNFFEELERLERE